LTGTISVDGATWFYREEGAPHLPALLLLHGFTGCAEFWDDIIAQLKAEFRCITVDLPGHGRNEFPPDINKYRMEAVAESLGKMLDEIRVTELNLWGYSMGGRLALHLALQYPHRVQRLILESTSPGILDPVQRQQRTLDDDNLAVQIERNGVAWFVKEWMKRPLFASQLDLPAERQALARDLRMRNSTTGLASSLRGMGTGVQEPLHDFLPELAIPTLVLVGEYDDKFRAIGLEMARLIPRVLYCLIPHAGHAPSWEQPESSANAVRSFLKAEDSAP
jgi:2-succinyl-6-hydroxy-2,4-cyclohexadiene-1-carboxylate synthase